MLKTEANIGRKVDTQDRMNNALTSGDTTDEDNNCLEKPEEILQTNGAASQVLPGPKELTEKKVQMSNGNKDGFTRVIHFRESVHLDIPK
ncbi:hypothetical protein LOAG_06182 [Loa loa]|nr:hypothetical protein LOAG_06182 [Loa loa]EFO22307.2 hypothetical protein LOAG_06182 [Loa loa]